MAPRSFWKGYLRLSLVTCRVAMVPATSARGKVRFHTINRATGNRIESRYVDGKTGKPVREGGLADVISGHAHVPPSQAGLPRATDAVFARALSRDPGDRPTPEEFAHRLREAFKPENNRPTWPLTLLLVLFTFAAFFAAAYGVTSLLR